MHEMNSCRLLEYHRVYMEYRGHMDGFVSLQVVVRSDKSGTTEIFKKALASFEEAFGTQVCVRKGRDAKGETTIAPGPLCIDEWCMDEALRVDGAWMKR